MFGLFIVTNNEFYTVSYINPGTHTQISLGYKSWCRITAYMILYIFIYTHILIVAICKSCS